jgi:hypothetical protein
VLLYRVEFYDVLLDTYKTFREPSLSEMTVVMAALAKMETAEAFSTASEILMQPPLAKAGLSKTSGGRVVALYAHFAYKLGQGPIL